ncbi:hypothetical protein ACQ3I4_09570 [Zafaria sp. Z1313]|uniref:hypothetical protein n=1 Tax=unclassified Zafaria TaxID=2828765 RepID=UPI002E77618C|nr:hypothetical protein [Zafaria sp. J156]MEE1621833.1 hypothetical protein [Zafaria sp. J156]
MIPDTLVTGRTGRASFSVPSQWTSESVRDEIELLAYLPGPDETFAPNVAVTVNPFEGTLDGFLLKALDGLASALTLPYIVDVRLWDVPGRVVHYTHDAPESGLRLRGCEFLSIQGGLALQVSATTTVAQWPVFSELLEKIARTAKPLEVGA